MFPGRVLQNWEHAGIQLENCTNIDIHGPFEQTYTNDQLGYAQGTIVGINEDALEYTVEVLSCPVHQSPLQSLVLLAVVFPYSASCLKACRAPVPMPGCSKQFLRPQWEDLKPASHGLWSNVSFLHMNVAGRTGPASLEYT